MPPRPPTEPLPDHATPGPQASLPGAAAGLSHPHIVTVFDAGLSNGDAYIAMELLKGADLRQLRLEGWQPTPLQAAQLVRHVAEALAYAHAHGVVHRDIKPANIFMVGRSQPRVLDFGIARVTHRHDLPPGQAVAGGSPYYMAPEQVLRQPVDARCDVFSLGVVMYELLAGVRPFRGETLAQIHRAMLEQRPPLASEVRAAVPKPLALIAARAMATDPDGRYASASAMERDLRQWLESRPAGAAAKAYVPTTSSLAGPLPDAIGRRWPAAALAAGAATALVVSLTVAAAWVVLAPREPPSSVLSTGPATLPKGLVQIDVNPWVQVEVDGIVVGMAPPLTQLALPEGRHAVTLRHAGSQGHTVDVDVAAGRPVVVTHRFAA